MHVPDTACAINTVKEGFQWSSDWQLDLEWSQSGWRYAAEWATEPDLWSKKDHEANTPLCRRKIFRVQMQRKDKEAAALEVSTARKQRESPADIVQYQPVLLHGSRAQIGRRNHGIKSHRFCAKLLRSWADQQTLQVLRN